MEDRNEAIRNCWQGTLHTLSPEIFNAFALTKDTRHFLLHVGLPQDVSLTLEYALEVNFYFDRDKVVQKYFKDISYLIVGDDGGTSLCISSHDDALYAIDFNDSSVNSNCFVNSSIWQFVYSLQVFRNFQRLSKQKSHNELILVNTMISKLKKVDESSFVNESSWWPTVVNPSL